MESVPPFLDPEISIDIGMLHGIWLILLHVNDMNGLIVSIVESDVINGH